MLVRQSSQLYVSCGINPRFVVIQLFVYSSWTSLIAMKFRTLTKVLLVFTLGVSFAVGKIFHNGRNVTNSYVNITQGSAVQISCSGEANSTSYWEKDKQNITTNTTRSLHQQASGAASILVIVSLQPAQAGTYKCKSRAGPVEEFLTIALLPVPTLFKVQGVTVTRTLQGSSPALRVSWSAVSGSGITYKYDVCYSTTSGKQSGPPSNANCDTRDITGTSTTLGPLSRGTTYYIWVAAVSFGGRRPYSDRRQSITYNVPGPVTSLQVRPSTTIFGLIITWGPPSGSNYPTPVSYRLRYRERPSSGSPGGWSTTVQRTATQRQYTTPVLKPGTRYKVEVWAVTSIGINNGSKSGTLGTTFQAPSPVANLTIEPIREDDGSISLLVSWDEPQSDQPITSYEGNYRTHTALTWRRQFSNITNQHKYANVLEGKNHDVRVRAVSSLGHGRFVIASALLPSLSVADVVSVTNDSISLRWNSTDADDFVVYYKELSRIESVVYNATTTVSEYNITDLIPFTLYHVTVSGRSVLGETTTTVESGASLVRTTESAPSVYPHTVMGRSVGMTWIYLVWSSVSGRGANGVIANYTVEVSLSGENENTNLFTVDANDPRFIGVKTITFNITGLRACTLYMVRVAASTSVGRGPYSEWVDIRTSSAPPPSNLTAVIVGSLFGALFLFVILVWLLVLVIVCVICLGRRFCSGSPPKSEPDKELEPVEEKKVAASEEVA